MRKKNMCLFRILVILLVIFFMGCSNQSDSSQEEQFDSLQEEQSDNSQEDQSDNSQEDQVTRNSINMFHIGVYAQDPLRERNGKINAQNYKDIGINTFVCLWKWPTEDWAYPGYSLGCANALQEAGMKVFAGDNLIPQPDNPEAPRNTISAVDWNEMHPEFQDTFIGYFLGDEPDMYKVNGDELAMPDNWNERGNELRRADPVRLVYANFGKGFSLDPWGGYNVAPGPTAEDDFGKYVAPLDVFSSDYYGITDPWEGYASHGIWTYGRAVENTKKYANSQIVWGYLEASGPWTDSENEGNREQLFRKMPPEYIDSIVWNMIIHGAQGIIYFCHDFTSDDLGSDAALADPETAHAMKVTNERVLLYSDILLQPDVPGISASSDGDVNIAILCKEYQGQTYIFAMGDGNTSNIFGQTVTGTITLPQPLQTETVDQVNVLHENRSVEVTNGTFNDIFEPYEVHIYSF